MIHIIKKMGESNTNKINATARSNTLLKNALYISIEKRFAFDRMLRFTLFKISKNYQKE